MFDYITYKTGIPRQALLEKHGLVEVMRLFVNCRVFEAIDRISSSIFMSEEDIKKAQRNLHNLSKVFFIEEENSEAVKAEAARIDENKLRALQMVERLAGFKVKVTDLRKK